MKSENSFLVIDLEFTCWRGRAPKGMMQEILDVGIVEIDLEKKVIKNKTRILVKPQKSKVSNFCTKLTSITQEEIDTSGIILYDAIQKLESIYDLKNIPWGSWGSFDKTQISKECKHKGIEFPFSKDYTDLQKNFSKFINDKRIYSVENALEKIGLKFEGIPHRADSDSYNTAIIHIKTI